MRIVNDNIIIRSVSLDDAPLLNTWWNDGTVMEHAGFPNGLGQSIEETIESINKWNGTNRYRFIIEIDNKSVGELNYSIVKDGVAEAGWKLCDTNYQNRGYGTRVIIMLLEYLFTDEEVNRSVPIKEVIWDTMLDNQRAQHVYESKIKATKLRENINTWQDQLGNWRSSVDYSIRKGDFIELVRLR